MSDRTPGPRCSRPPALAVLLALLVLLPADLVRAQSAGEAGSFTVKDAFEVRGVGVDALSPDGAAALIRYTTPRDRIGIDNYRFGDPTYVAPVLSEVALVDTRTGEHTSIFDEKRQLAGSAWSPDGERLALVVRRGGVREARENAPFDLVIRDGAGRLRTVELPADRILAHDTDLRWSPDGSELYFAVRSLDWEEAARERFLHEVHGPIVVRSSANDFLSWEEIRRKGRVQSLARYHVVEGRVEEIVAEDFLGGWDLTEDGEWLRLHRDMTEGTGYDQIFGTEHRIEVRRPDGAEERVLFPSDDGLTIRWAGDGRSWAYLEEGELLFGSLELEEPRRLAGPEEDPDEEEPGDAPDPDDEPDDDPDEEDEEERFNPVRLSHDGSLLVASNDEGFWLFDTSTGEREHFLVQDPDEENAPRWSVAEWDRDGEAIYLTYASRTEWERGIYRYDRATGETVELVLDGRRYSGLRLSEHGGTLLVNVADGARPAELFASDADLGELRPLTDSNPWLADRRLGEAELMEYLDVDGETLYGVLHYPPDYEPGRRYPTVFILYETFFDESFNSMVALLGAHGYVVVQPSVNLVRGYPGEGWLKGVTAAANQLIDRGIADPDRLGIQGVSYGGYAVNLLVAQTPRFAAAINISGKTNMVSFYTDSPRLGTRNIHAPERSQDRIGATLWEQPHKYLAHSAVMMADRIETPLLLLTGQQDHNVTERTTSEMYYALRRLGADVEWVSYIDGGHGMPRSTEAEAVDYHQRILEWYERHMGEAAEDVAEPDG